MTNWTIHDIPSQAGRVSVVTGSTGGLGFAIAKALAGAGSEVIVAGRDQSKGRTALEQIRQANPRASVRFELLDLANLKSVHAFSTRLLEGGQAIDLLVNNAGVMTPPKRLLTSDGFELQFGTNHLGHFALTGLLLPLLRRGKSPRVVTISSLAHRGGKIQFDDLNFEKKYNAFAAYGQSKLANLLFTFELQRRSNDFDWGLLSDAAHPGYARTDLIANGPGMNSVMGLMSKLMGSLASQSADDAALPALFAATSPNALPTGYYGPKNMFEMKGPVADAVVAKQAKDPVVARRLWQVSEELTGVRFPEA